MPHDIAPQVHDVVLKHLSQLFVGRTLEPLGLGTLMVTAAIPTELPEVSVRARGLDHLFEVADGTLLHLEFQSGRHAVDLTRFLLYDALVFQRHGRPIRTAVLHAGRERRAGDRVDAGSLQHQVEHVYLGAMDGDAAVADLLRRRDTGTLRREGGLAIALIVLKRFAARTRVEAVRAAMELAEALPDERSRGECQASVLGLAQRYLSQSQFALLAEVGDVSRALDRLIEEGWTKGKAEGMAQGRAEGMAEGMAQGRAEGKVEGKADALLRTLRNRFGDLPPSLVHQVSQQRDGAALDRWLDVAMDAPSLLDFERGMDR